MKIPQLLSRKKKLRASTARRSLNAPDEMDYEEMSEPNMRLSRALLIVLVLHVVAVAGIIAFNTIKTRQGATPQSTATGEEMAAVAPSKPEKTKSNSSSQTKEAAKPALPLSKDDRGTESARAQPVSESADAKTYVVVKGDNPVSIARKFKVSESELLKINNIEDPRKLQIGHKLVIPTNRKTRK